MLNIPHLESLKQVAQRLVWFKKPEEALEDPYLFIAHVMTYGTIEDVSIIKKVLGIYAFQKTLDNMPPGIIDEKSWNYWNIVLGKYPVPALPTRSFDP